MEKEWGLITVAADKMSATITLKKPPENTPAVKVTPEMLQDLILEEGIKVVPDGQAINKLCTSAAYGEAVEVVHGKAPVNGADGFYTFSVPMEDMRAKPVIKADGTADYRNSLKLAVIHQGEVFAVYTKSTPGTYGFDLFNGMVAPKPGRELPVLRGAGVVYDEEKAQYSAEYDGHIIFSGNSIKIDKLFRVDRDLDMSTGNLDFTGDVEIMGDVRSGMSIKSGGSVFIHGHVGACNITADKDITIEKGIQGHDKCLIKAKGKVVCKFVERCRIEAGSDLFADSILDATVISKSKITVNSKSGNVVGGNVRGTLGVTVKEAGNETETPTILQAGISREDLELARDYTQRLLKLDEKMLQLEQHQQEYDAIENPSPQIMDLKMKIMRAKVVVASDQMQIHTILDPLSELINAAKRDSSIRVLGVANAGVKIHINGVHYQITEACKDVNFREVCDQIVVEAGE